MTKNWRLPHSAAGRLQSLIPDAPNATLLWEPNNGTHGKAAAVSGLPVERGREFPTPPIGWALHPPPQGQTGRAVGTDNDVVEQPNFHQLQRLLDARRDGAVGGGRLGVA